MRAAVMYGAGDVRVENVPDAHLAEPTDALRVTRACICGSDPWPYNQLEPTETGRRMGHEFVGVVEKDDVNDELDAAYRAKYGRRYPSIVPSILAPETRAATLKLVTR